MTVVVTTGARLHFGLLCGAPDSGWHYGGVGMMVDQPAWKIQVSWAPASETDVIHAEDITRDRVQKVLSRFRHVVADLSAVECTVHHAAPFHSGLGAGTQFTLALGTALLMLTGKPRPDDIAEFASTLDRSRRSAVGTYGFDHGGFVVDHGIPRDPMASRSFDRIRFPDSWRRRKWPKVCPVKRKKHSLIDRTVCLMTWCLRLGRSLNQTLSKRFVAIIFVGFATLSKNTGTWQASTTLRLRAVCFRTGRWRTLYMN